MYKDLEIKNAKYVYDNAYLPLTVLANNQNQRYIDMLIAKEAREANKEMANLLINEYLPQIEGIKHWLANIELPQGCEGKRPEAVFSTEFMQVYQLVDKLANILRVRLGSLLDFLAGLEKDQAALSAILGQTFYDFRNTIFEYEHLHSLLTTGKGTYNLTAESVRLIQQGMTYWDIADIIRMPCTMNVKDIYYWCDQDTSIALSVKFDNDGEATYIHSNV